MTQVLKTTIAAAILVLIPSLAAAVDNKAQECLERATQHYGVEIDIMLAIKATEGGTRGMSSDNSNGTQDHGEFQINDFWFEKTDVLGDLTAKDVRDNSCINAWVATYIYARQLAQTGDTWKAVGNYHSRTPKHHYRYRIAVYSRYQEITKSKKEKQLTPRLIAYSQY